MAIIGISCFYHDSAVCCINDDGVILAAAQEERFSRIKHDSAFPELALKYCSDVAAQNNETIEHIVFYENPMLKFDRVLKTALTTESKDEDYIRRSLSKWTGQHIFQIEHLFSSIQKVLPEFTSKENISILEHHASHASSAFYPSPFRRAAIITLDGVGEYTSSTIAIGTDNSIALKKEIHHPDSLGLLYSAFTFFTGFKVNSGEYKMMGLAPYGMPKYKQQILDHIVDVRSDGSFKLNQDCFHQFASDIIITEKFDEVLGLSRREPQDFLDIEYAHVAASIQEVTEDIIIKIVNAVVQEFEERNICLAGGVALNCVANGRISRECNIDNLWIQPAAGDAGGALGAAFYYHYQVKGNDRHVCEGKDNMQGGLLGPEYDSLQVRTALDKLDAEYTEIGCEQVTQTVANLLSQGNTVAWFQGRMEFGPRALGNRSILGDPRDIKMQKKLNLKVKKRESFRPFAPSVMEDKAKEWFDMYTQTSPFMLIVSDLRKDKRLQVSELEAAKSIRPYERHSLVPAITHVNYSARVQTVNADTNPLYYDLISKFFDLTDCPMLVNTSFNIRGEPVVESPEDAFKCFMNTEIDYLVMGPYLVSQEDQDPILKMKFKRVFAPD